MISRFKLSLTVGIVLLLSACGQRGPLYLPSEAPQNQPPPVESQLESADQSTPAILNQKSGA